MNVKYYPILTLVVLLPACQIMEEQVFYGEMAVPPIVITESDSVIIRTANSVQNTAHSISRVRIEFDDSAYIVIGFQRVGAEYRERFPFLIKEIGVDNTMLTQLPWYWEDKDGHRHKLSVTIQ